MTLKEKYIHWKLKRKAKKENIDYWDAVDEYIMDLRVKGKIY